MCPKSLVSGFVDDRPCVETSTMLTIVDVTTTETADHIMSFRTTPSMAKRIRDAAKAERRPVSNYLAVLVEDALDSEDAA